MSSTELLSTQNRPFLQNQIEAVVRVLALKRCPMAFDEITAALSEAEQKANFMCGFGFLHQDTAYRDALCAHLVANGVLETRHDGRMSLTAEGHRFAECPLPPQIEAHLT